jgi:hypothetical protein
MVFTPPLALLISAGNLLQKGPKQYGIAGMVISGLTYCLYWLPVLFLSL